MWTGGWGPHTDVKHSLLEDFARPTVSSAKVSTIRMLKSEGRRESFGLPKMMVLEFSLWLRELRTIHSVCEDAGAIPGLAEWVRD